MDLAVPEIDSALTDLIARGAIRVPPFPAVAMRLGRMLADPDFDLPEVARLVSTDQALAADVLRCANSALFRGVGTVTALPAAITRIGARDLMGILMASLLGGYAEAHGPLVSLRRQIWRQSLTAAVLAQMLAPRKRLPGDEGFVCGLLHDFGKLVAVTGLEHLASERKDLPKWRLRDWAALVERHHVDLGLAVASRWKLPEAVTETIREHHRTEGARAGSVVELIVACDALLALLESHVFIPDDELMQVPGLGTREDAAFVSLLLPRLPDVVASLAGTAEPVERRAHLSSPDLAATTPSLVDRGASSLCGDPRPAAIPASSIAGGQRLPFTASAVAADGLALKGAAALPENRLARLELQLEGGPLELWVNVLRCVPDGDPILIECKPFALTGAARTRFERLHQDLSAAQAS